MDVGSRSKTTLTLAQIDMVGHFVGILILDPPMINLIHSHSGPLELH